mmetsp:Transcript_1021/g.2210  ORF Transcript_1021/g.2210 Transcript_1021/m.2210 type:complete len:545 (-) Transcript_1021:37-1671(-)
MFGIRNGLSLCHEHHNRDHQQQEQDHDQSHDQQHHQRDPYSLSPSSAGGPSSSSAPSVTFCFGGGIIGPKGVVNLLTITPPSSSNHRLSNISNNDLFVPILDHTDHIESSNDDEDEDEDEDEADEEERDVDEFEDGNDIQFDELDLQYEDEYHHDIVDNEFETCSYIYEIDPALAVEKNGTFLRDTDEVSEVTMKAFDGHEQSGRRRHRQRRRLLSMKRFGRGITNRLSWRGSLSSSRQPEKAPASPSSSPPPVPGIDKVETRDENNITTSTNNKSVTQSSSSTCSILLIDPDSRQFEIVESPYTPNVSSCDEMLELPSLRSGSKSFRIRFQQYVGLVLFHLHTDEDGNTDVIDLETTFNPGQTIPYLQQHQATMWRRQQPQQKQTPTNTTSTPKHEDLMLNISSWFSKKSFSSSASEELLKVVSKSSHDSPSQSQHKSLSPTASCPHTPTTVGTTIVIPSSATPPEPAKLNGLITTKRIRTGFGRIGDGIGEGTGNVPNQNNNPGVVPLLVAIPNGLPTDEVKELAQNLLSFPQVVSTLIKKY